VTLASRTPATRAMAMKAIRKAARPRVHVVLPTWHDRTHADTARDEHQDAGRASRPSPDPAGARRLLARATTKAPHSAPSSGPIRDWPIRAPP